MGLKPYKLMENQCGLSTGKRNRLSGPNHDFMHKYAACREVWECPQRCLFTKMQVECSIWLVATVSFIPQPIFIPSIPDDHVAMDILIHVNHTQFYKNVFMPEVTHEWASVSIQNESNRDGSYNMNEPQLLYYDICLWLKGGGGEILS